MRLDELNKLNPYEYMDKQLDSFRRYMVQQFERYLVNIRKGSRLRLTKELYAKLSKRANKMILRIVIKYNQMAGGTPKYDEDWLFDYLLEFDPITGYQYSNEWERKMYRQYEEAESEENPRKKIKRAMTLLNQQVTQKCIEAADRGTIDGYKQRGIKKVRWRTMEDERVCGECAPRDMVIYDIDKIPEKHYFCRCWLEEVE